MAVDLIDVDPAYQRDTASRASQKLIARIVATFSWRKFKPPTLAAKADGRYACIDGQHSVEGARLRQVPAVPSYIIAAETVQEQADSFVALNRDRVAITSLQLFHSRLAAGDPEALKIAYVCEQAGVTIARWFQPGNTMEPGVTLAVATIRRAIVDYGETIVIDALNLLAEAYAEAGGQLIGPAIKAMCHFFHWHEGRVIDWRRLATAVGELDMVSLRETAVQSKALFGGKAEIALSITIARAYNKGLRDPTKRLPEQV